MLRPPHGRHRPVAFLARRRHGGRQNAQRAARARPEELCQRRQSRQPRLPALAQRRPAARRCGLRGRELPARLRCLVDAARRNHQATLRGRVHPPAPHRPALHQLASLLGHHRELPGQGWRALRCLPRELRHPQGRGVVHGRRMVLRRPLVRLRLLQQLRVPSHVSRNTPSHEGRPRLHAHRLCQVLRPRPEARAEIQPHPRTLHLTRGHFPRVRPFHPLPHGHHAAARAHGLV